MSDGGGLKARVHQALVEALRDDLAMVVAAQKLTAEGVTHADAKSDGSKDMRATEASYIARGQAQRAQALEEELARVQAMKLRRFGEDDAIAIGALVELEGTSHAQVFVAPGGGGARLNLTEAVQVVTPKSPLGRALIGAREGDFVEVRRAGQDVEIEVLGIA